MEFMSLLQRTLKENPRGVPVWPAVWTIYFAFVEEIVKRIDFFLTIKIGSVFHKKNFPEKKAFYFSV